MAKNQEVEQKQEEVVPEVKSLSLKELKEGNPSYNLLLRNPMSFKSWTEFMRRWIYAETIEEMLGLLHCGFDIELNQGLGGSEVENRIIFYLTIADGWKEATYFFQTDEDRRFDTGHTQMYVKRRKEIAEKAFAMLCQNLFKTPLLDGGGIYYRYDWEEISRSEMILPAIQEFFNTDERTGGRVWLKNIRGFGYSHPDKEAMSFLVNLSMFIWGYGWSSNSRATRIDGRTDTHEKREFQKSLDSAKPWTIEILSCLREYELLEEFMEDPGFDKACLKKLRDLAMRKEIGYPHLNKKRKVRTLDEACLLGSNSAWLLKKHELRLREIEKFRKIREAEEEKRSAEIKLREIKEAEEMARKAQENLEQVKNSV